MSIWKEVQLKDLAIKITKGTTPTTMGYEFQDSGINFIKAESITQQGCIDDSTFAHIDNKTHAALKRSQIEDKDILLTIAGIYLGKVGLVEKRHLPANTNQAVAIVRPDKARVLPDYLKHFFFNQGTTTYLNMLCPQSAQPNLNLTQLGCLRFNLPPLPIQRKIAAILSAYDDLIENNKRRIALLEKMAEEIYREWFVRMRFPGHEKVKMVKGVPEGWEVKNLSALAKINESSIGKSTRPEVIHYVDISSVSTNTIGDVPEINFSDAPGRARRVVKHGDIIWSSVRPANRAYCLIYKPPENMIVSTGFAVISPRKNVPYTFLKYATTSDAFVEQMTTVAKGAAYPATSFDDFEKAKILTPTESLLREFDRIVEPIFGENYFLSKHNQVLAKSRDFLLPRLISGKLSVENLDIQFPPSMREELVPQAGAQRGFSDGHPKASTRKAMQDAKAEKTVKGFRIAKTRVADLEDG